tara:strand:- start:365 stop:2203 length:1839 start_codon:yes stop_codon:yes gene_type:complete
MLNIEPKNLLEELQAAERLRDAHLDSMGDQVERYHGPFYKKNFTQEYTGENHYYEYISLMIPRLIYDNPRVRVSSRRAGTQEMVADAMRYAINNWVKETRFRKTLEGIAADTLFNYGVALISETENRTLASAKMQQDSTVPMWPKCSRIPQHRFVIDPIATSMEEARFVGHKWVRDKEDLLEMAKKSDDWNAKEIEEISTTTDKHELGREYSDMPDRKEIVCYEIWVPEHQLEDALGPDDGFHGTIFTLGVTQNPDDESFKTAYIRKPRAYYGPAAGPYVMFGVYPVPNSIYPLSPLVAIEGQVMELNTHVASAAKSAEQYKKLILVDNTDPKFVQRVKDAQDNFVIPVSGLERQRVVQAEVGGMSPAQLQYLQIARDRLDRNSGVSDAQRGNVEGRGTATEVQVASEASTIRIAFVKQQFADAVQRVLETVAWFFYYDDRVVAPLGLDGAAALGLENPWLVGGDPDRESGETFEDLELDIEPYSMERTSEGTHQRKVMEMFQLIMNTAPMVPQMPYVNWKDLYSKLGDALNIPQMAELVNVDMASMMAGAPPQADPQQMRFEKDVGKAGKARPVPTEAEKFPGQIPKPDSLLPGQASGIQVSQQANQNAPL